MTTKEQERQAIEKIRKIVEGLGENSYVGFAMEGVLELAEDNIREELSRNNAETREMIHETYQEIAEQLEIEGDWDEVYVQDQFNDDYEVRDVIEAFYDCMIEKVLNYIGAE